MSKIGKKQLNISFPEGIFNLIKIKKITYSPLFSQNKEDGKNPKVGIKEERISINTFFHKLIISGPLGTQSIFISDLFKIEILSDSLKIIPSNNNTLNLDKKMIKDQKRDQL